MPFGGRTPLVIDSEVETVFSSALQGVQKWGLERLCPAHEEL